MDDKIIGGRAFRSSRSDGIDAVLREKGICGLLDWAEENLVDADAPELPKGGCVDEIIGLGLEHCGCGWREEESVYGKARDR